MPLIAAHTIDPEHGDVHVYCGMDSMATKELDLKLDASMPDDARLIYGFERAMTAPALEMMLRGFRVDPVERERARLAARAKRAAVDAFIERAVVPIVGGESLPRNSRGDITFPNSDVQLKSFFYDNLGLVPIQRSIKGVVRTPMDHKTIEKLTDYFYARPIATAILLRRDLDSQLEVLEREIDNDWRWRCSYNVAGTDTGRWSSSASILGLGSNFQNITDELRRIFIPDDGWRIAGFDKEQAEAREVGYFCGVVLNDWSYLDACESGDLHTYVTRLTYPDWAWTGDLKQDRKLAERRFHRHHTYRDASKRLGHGSNYVGKPPTLSAETHIPLPLVREFQERYFTAFPCIPRMHAWVAREIQTQHHLTTFFGRRRDFFDRADSDETLRSAVAYLFQSATGDRLNREMWHVWRHMGERVQLLAQLHDAFYYQYRLDDDERDVIESTLALTHTPLTAPNGRVFDIPTEAVTGMNWAHRWRLTPDGALEDWNPKGLDKWRPN